MKPDRSKDRPAMLALVDVLNTRPKLVGRDECGDWTLFGAASHAYAIPEANAYYFMFGCPGRRAWNNLKRRLSFCVVTQDGDDEGILRLSGLSNKVQAEQLRKAMGLPIRRRLSPERRAKAVINLRPIQPRGSTIT